MAPRKTLTDDTSPLFDQTIDLPIIVAPAVTGEVSSVSSEFASQAAPALAPDPFCPRQIIFTIPGKPGVQVTATEDNGAIDFTVDVLDDPTSSGDLRGLFFHFNESKLATLQVTGTDATNWITGTQIKANSVIDLLDGANMSGAAKPFDVGIKFGTPGTVKDDIFFPVHFTLSDAANDLKLDDFAHLQFGARLDSVGGPGGSRGGGVSKIVGIAPAAPQAVDDPATTHEDQSVIIHPLTNDSDGDGDKLTITEVHLESGAHGTVAIAADGQSFTFTPDKDYAGLNFDPGSTDATFEYCVSDGHGGQDSANVNVHIIPVADPPTITFDVLAPETNDPINMVRLKVTAAQSDADGSEFIDRIAFGPLPDGVTLIGADDLNPADQPGSIVKYVQLMLPTAQQANFQDIDFNLNVTAYSQEKGNGDPDEASATGSKEIKVDFTHNQTQQTFDAIDQSIWTTGSGAPFERDPFIGPNVPFNESQTFITPTLPPLPVKASVDGHFKIGLQVDVKFDGGHITAHLPYDITIDTTYNETTDSLLVHTGADLAPGANFTTTGPEGDIKADFVIDFLANIKLEDGIAGVVGIDQSLALQPPPVHLLDLSSTGSDLPDVVQLPGGFSITVDWPHLSGGSTSQSGNEVFGDASSNPFVKLNLDADAAAAFYFPPFQLIESIIDPDPLSDSNFELFDLDVNANANLIQKFVLDALNLNGTLIAENDPTKTFTFKVGDDLPIIRNASSLDGPDANTTIDFALAMTPNATLDNETSVGLNVGGQIGLLKNIPVIDKSLVDEPLNIPVASIPVYDTDPFKLNFNSGTYDFVV